MKRTWKVFRIVPIIFVTLMCTSKTDTMKFDSNTYSDLDSLILKIQGKRIFFGHQSVGNNIMQGLVALNNQSSAKLNIVTGRDTTNFGTAFFAHDAIGKNKDPLHKLNDFCDLLESDFGDKIDIAFFKFCYVDIKRQTPVDTLFSLYVKRLEKIQAMHPNLFLIPVTVPVKVVPKGIKNTINMVIRKDHSFTLNRLNKMLREHYGEEKIFDLARIEATLPNGSINQKYENDYLVADYTYDGGHLTDEASKLIAYRMLQKLNTLN